MVKKQYFTLNVVDYVHFGLSKHGHDVVLSAGQDQRGIFIVCS